MTVTCATPANTVPVSTTIPQDLMTAKAIANALGYCNADYVRSLARKGRIPCYQMHRGARVMFSRSEVVACFRRRGSE